MNTIIRKVGMQGTPPVSLVSLVMAVATRTALPLVIAASTPFALRADTRPPPLPSATVVPASTDTDGTVSFHAEVLAGSGHIYVNGEQPAESYAPGSLLAVSAVPEDGNAFIGWVGEGFADPTAAETTYTVRNASVIGAIFGTPIRTVEDFVAIPEHAVDAYVLMADLNFASYCATGTLSDAAVKNFKGRIFGQNHTISGFVITNASDSQTVALFDSILAGAEIHDLIVESAVSNCQAKAAGLVREIGDGSLVTNCHVRLVAEAQPHLAGNDAGADACHYFGFAQTVDGSDIRIVDCTAEIKAIANGQTSGFVGTAFLAGGEIARCAAFAEVLATNSNCTGSGHASGFAETLSLSDGAMVRECFASGVVDGAGEAAGFANSIIFSDSASAIHDCYSTADVMGRGNSAYGFASSLTGSHDGDALVTNVWFGGTVRAARGDTAYSFAKSVDHVSLANCVYAGEAPASATDGVAQTSPAAARSRAFWTGYDFDSVWSMTEGSTTPYFAWSVSGRQTAAPASFRLFAIQEDGKTIMHPATAAPGTEAVVSADSGASGAFFCGWAGAGTYAGTHTTPTTLLADNHRTVRAVWGQAISTREELSAISLNPSGSYGLASDIDLSGENWTPICQSVFTPFSGMLYGRGHTISNLTVDTHGGSFAGLFGCLVGATITELRLVNPVVKGGSYTGILAGQIQDGTAIRDCSTLGAEVAATGNYAGMLIGHVAGSTSISRCYALGTITSSGNYAGGLVGSIEGGRVSECFASGLLPGAGNYIGGFVGHVTDSAVISDCYTLVSTAGRRYIGGFTGYASGSATLFARCYASGSTFGLQDVGSFAGCQFSFPSFADCVRPDDGLSDIGSSDHDGIVALDADDFHASSHFGSFLENGLWTQTDGLTQPYFPWSLASGMMRLSGLTAGTGAGVLDGMGLYAPGDTVTISAIPQDSVFVNWIGDAPYANPAAPTTTVLLDNFRIVTAEFGSLIMNVEQLGALANARDGSYALGTDIDLSGVAWTPIGTSSAPFTGSLYGQGHAITGLHCDNASGNYMGLFGVAKDATLVDIHLEDVVINGRQYTGALAGETQGATTIRHCSASGVVSNNYGYAGLLVGRAQGSGARGFENCAATGTVFSTSDNTGGLVGGTYFYPAVFVDCDANVSVVNSGGNNKGGFIGSVSGNDATASFTRCTAEGNVAASTSSQVGGFIGYAGNSTSFADCSASGAVSGKGTTGGFAGKAEGAASTYLRCHASGDVISGSSSYAGGFIGLASGQNACFDDCMASGNVSSTASQTGGFVGNCGARGLAFTGCSACGDVSATLSETGGFAGIAGYSNLFTRCSASGTVFGGFYNVGGFIGTASGADSQFAECAALGSVAGLNSRCGGFAGQSTGPGIRFAECRALGGVSSKSCDIGGFVGLVSNSNSYWRCISAGSATGTYDIGGFAGKLFGPHTTIAESFALGDATGTSIGDAFVGGFAGTVPSATHFSDSYCLGTATGTQKVGGFAGHMGNASITTTRCYAAGVVACSGTYAGAFLGHLQDTAATFADCAAPFSGIHAIGCSTSGSTAEDPNIAELAEEAFRTSSEFAAYHDTGLWMQLDGTSQPYLAWSAPGGDLTVFASIGGSAHGSVDGAGSYPPGTAVTLAAVSDEGFFVTWTGSTPYADSSCPATTVPLDNHRVAAVQFGRFIMTANDLDAVRNDLAGIYGLGADIDLANFDWTPIGTRAEKFTGKLFGLGHVIENMVLTNNPSGNYMGLFGCTDGATLSGITLSGTIRGGQCVGGLVGAAAASSITNCSAKVSVSSTSQNAGGLIGRIDDATIIVGCSAAGTVTTTSLKAGGFAGGSNDGSTTFEIRDSWSSVETIGGQYVGGFIGYVSGGGTSTMARCRADGYASGNGDVGGFVGYAASPLTISGCAARGDVRSSDANYGGFAGQLSNAAAAISDCWCSGAIWGTGNYIGSFIGYLRQGTVRNSSVCLHGSGPRPFCGNSPSVTGGLLTIAQNDQLSASWPPVTNHSYSATPISTAEELFDVTNHLDGIYMLTEDIDLGGAEWQPIGNSATGYSGEFYGQNHTISNFTVSAAANYAGLFARISGGRVSGLRASGSVSPTYTGSGSTAAGGFAGRIDSKSLVDACVFDGTVSNSMAYLGGFAGYVDGDPAIVRCSFSGSVAQTAGRNYSAGFVGFMNGGSVVDSYAIADVTAGAASYVGGFAGYLSGKVLSSWCACSIAATGNRRGAFAGNALANRVEKSYYDQDKTTLLAVGLSGISSTVYDGITPLTSAEMLYAANFPGLDFDKTWNIDEGETTPYLQTFTAVKKDFDVWLKKCGYPEDTRPGEFIDGIAAGMRYVFNIPPDITSLDGLDPPFFSVVTDQTGNPCVKFRPLRDPYAGVDVTTTICATTDLDDWTHLVPMTLYPDGTYKPTEYGVNPDYVFPPQMFFKWRLDIDRTAE